jgi:hypothetical protein
MKRYRVCREQFFDENGDSKHRAFYVEKRHTFLGISYWKPVRHRWYGEDSAVTKFLTYEEACDFCRKLMHNRPIDKWETKVIDYF